MKISKSVRKSSTLLKIARLIVSDINVKWKQQGSTAAQSRTGRPHEMTHGDHRVLNRIMQQNHISSVGRFHTEFQSASGNTVSTRNVRRELHKLGINGRADAHKSNITKINASCWLKLVEVL
ncbi:hypothetical protein ANN_21102 [Periplaneta americana]|uniref:Transposase Tc1-like domain-containing protein n=1 Tax=Periplaneta americana TaxID=6978 RepID=A0ABQ8SER3_PERAM|nr:hypothetical protein ANN_21102 [Periplaneta americana]